ncbi:helix-turn-helix domain-containing protein [Lacrimispora sp.]|uniref:helix-turn-helix domain-containing protein n=1 Tax=Lacrimispora sp. TaxID=2719234 RepID=UPI0028AD2056|nr:helix-turn-helix transcriptional regulator [Lacrimispora sp.]
MGLYEQIRDVAKARGYSINRLEQELGFARSSINKFNKNAPSADKLQKIAETLGVTVDYLMTGNLVEDSEHYYANEETREIAQEIFENPDLRSLFHAARDLTPERLKAHIDFMQSLKQQEEKHNDEGC